jgi:hypothetical protein
MKAWLTFWRQCAGKALRAGKVTYAAAGGFGALAFAVFEVVRYIRGQPSSPGIWASGILVAVLLGAVLWGLIHFIFIAPFQVSEDTRTTLVNDTLGRTNRLTELERELEELRTQRSKRQQLSAILRDLTESAAAIEQRALQDGYDALEQILAAIRVWNEQAKMTLTAVDANVWTRLSAAPAVTGKLEWMDRRWGSHMENHVEAWQLMRGKLNKLDELSKEVSGY